MRTKTTAPKIPMQISASLKVDDRRVLVRSADTIPDTADCMDERIRLLAVDLAAQASNINVDDVGRGIEMEIPHVLQQHGARHDAALVANQIFEELKFARKQVDALGVSVSRPRHEVELEVADTQYRCLDDRVAAPSKRLDAREELGERERFDEIVVASGTQAAHAIVYLAEC